MKTKQAAFAAWQESRGHVLREQEGASWDEFAVWWDARTDTTPFESLKLACSESWIAAQGRRFEVWFAAQQEASS